MHAPDGNLFTDGVDTARAEDFTTLLAAGHTKLVRIVSTGQATPEGEWYDQDQAEWVVVLRGSAGLKFEDEAQIRTLQPGDFVLIPAHRRHRVEWTDASEPTVWLALYYQQ
jgi:cupin 2 domain-containing protein